MKLLDGKELSKKINLEIKQKIQALKRTNQKKPGLAVVIIGDKKDSLLYVNMKRKVCKEIGIESKLVHISENFTTENIVAIIDILNRDNTVNGILVQLPLPEHINEETVLTSVSLEKDVDGFHSSNIGNVAMENRTPLFTPCTPLGCIRLLDEYNIDLLGKNVVVIGKSNIVGLPISLMLMKRNATVTVCHKHTQNLQQITKNADILVSACGQAEMIKKEWVKEGVVIIDIGISYITDPENQDKKKIVGDIDFKDVSEVASYITPVPGGVGPMTVSMLMENTYNSFVNNVK